MSALPTPHPIILYDGVCGLCNRFVQFVLRHDREASFRFAALQSTFAAPILMRHGVNPDDLDTVYVVTNHDQAEDNHQHEVLLRSDAVIFVLKQLGGTKRVCGFLLQLLPTSLRDAAYKFVARNRYRIFGRTDTCPIPNQATRTRFLDV